MILKSKNLKKYLKNLGFSVRQIVNVKTRLTKLPLPLFFVNLEPNQNNKEIFKLNSLCRTKIKVEEPYPRRQIIQCLRCQDFRHSRTYCNYEPRCVKYGDNHLTSECKIPADQPPKCTLCEGQHPANYRNCSLYKNLQQTPKKSNKNKPTFPIKVLDY